MSDEPSMDFRKARQLGPALYELAAAKGVPKEDMDQVFNSGENKPFGFDFNYVTGSATDEPREILRFSHPKSGRQLTMYSNQAGVQVYTGNWINNVKGKGGAIYNQWQGVAFEPQSFPDAIEVDGNTYPEFKKGECYVVRPNGKPYSHKIVY